MSSIWNVFIKFRWHDEKLTDRYSIAKLERKFLNEWFSILKDRWFLNPDTVHQKWTNFFYAINDKQISISRSCYRCNKITKTRIQISRQNWNVFVSDINRQIIIQLTYQILTNDDQMLILCLSYFITTVCTRCGRVMADNTAYAKFRKTLLIW